MFQSTLGVVSCMAWKGDLMVLADNEGNLSVWELKARITRSEPQFRAAYDTYSYYGNILIASYCRLVATHRGQIKKIKFAPGRGNFKLSVLYNDGMDVWDLHQVYTNNLGYMTVTSTVTSTVNSTVAIIVTIRVTINVTTTLTVTTT